MSQLQLGALPVARVRAFDEHLGSPSRQPEVFLGLFQLVGNPAQLLARDEAFLHERPQAVMLVAQTSDLLLGQLEARLRLVHGQGGLALGKRLDRRLRLLAFDIGNLQVDEHLTQFLARAFEVCLELGGVQPDQQVAYVDPRAFGHEGGNFRFPTCDRGAVGHRLRGPQNAGSREPGHQRPATDRRRDHIVGGVGELEEACSEHGSHDDGDRQAHASSPDRACRRGAHFVTCPPASPPSMSERGSRMPTVARMRRRVRASSASVSTLRLSAFRRFVSAVTTSRLFDSPRS